MLKKEIINCEITENRLKDNNTGWARLLTPIPGIRAFCTKPTSSNVHLYYDMATLNTARPILFADSEGLLGGNQTPFASSIESVSGIARYLICPHVQKPLTDNKSRKMIPWKDSTQKMTRKYCVEHIYPRILYAFSEVLCYVIQQNIRVMESLVSQMIIWADKARNASLNQVILPRVILVLNNVTLSEVDRNTWENGESATETVVNALKNCIISGELEDIATRWNDILDADDRINSVMDLFLRYFKSLSVVYIPPIGYIQQAARFYIQVQQLRKKILSLSNEVRIERINSFHQLDSRQLESLFNIGIEHFFTKLDEPFDFFPHARFNRPLAKSVAGNARYLMTRMDETESNQLEFDRRCKKLFASYYVIMVLCERMSGTNPFFIYLAGGTALYLEADQYDK